MKCKRTRSLKSKTPAVVVACICLAALAACERALTLDVTNHANPPTFKLSGNGGLIYLFVFEVTPGERLSGDDRVMWKIKPTTDEIIDDLPEITYGVVPPDFEQIEPASGSPPPLVEGMTYEIGGPAYNAAGGWTRFRIKDGRAVTMDGL